MAPESEAHVWRFPGKVLIVDDEYGRKGDTDEAGDEEEDNAVIEAVSQLVQAGVPIEYWNAKSDRRFLNVRIVLLDLVLQKGKHLKEDEDDFYFDAVDALKKIPGKPVVIVLSSVVSKEKVKQLAKVYEHRVGQKFQGIFSQEGMPKGDLEDTRKLLGLIESAVKGYESVELSSLWESALDSAKDRLIEEVFSEEKLPTIRALIELLDDEAGRNSLGREFMNTILRILTRFTKDGDAFEKMNDKLKAIASETTRARVVLDEIGGASTGRLHYAPLSLIMYYNPENERIWTGDIYQTTKELGRQYAMVMTPVCDFAQDKTQKIMICYGFRIGKKEFGHRNEFGSFDNPIYAKDKKLKERLDALLALQPENRTRIEEELLNSAIKKYLSKDAVHSERFYKLAHFFPDEASTENFPMLCFDFQDVESISDISWSDGRISDWNRVRRLDSPYADLLLQEFGVYLSRLGVLGIGSPME